MDKVVTQVSVALLVAAGSIVSLSTHMTSTVEAVDIGSSSKVVVTDRDGYFIVTMGPVEMILASDSAGG